MKYYPKITREYLFNRIITNFYGAWGSCFYDNTFTTYGFNWEKTEVKGRFQKFLTHLETTSQLNSFYVYLYLQQKILDNKWSIV